MTSKRLKTSAEKAEILKGLDPQVISNAHSISAVVSDFEKKVFNEPLSFQVGKYEVRVDAKGTRAKPDLYLSCSCSYWQYQGCEYHALKNSYLFGIPRGTGDAPVTRDPNGTHKVCKHVYAVLRDYF